MVVRVFQGQIFSLALHYRIPSIYNIIQQNAIVAQVTTSTSYLFLWYGTEYRENPHLEDTDVDGRITLKWIFKKWDGGGGMDAIDLTQDRNKWRALVTPVTNLRFLWGIT